MSRRLVLLLALVLGLFVVEPAYASPVDGFTNGLNDFVHPDSAVGSDVTPERDFIEGYEPVLLEEQSRDEGEQVVTPMDGIQSFANGVSFQWDGSTVKPFINFNLIFKTRPFLIMVVSIAVLFVFMWWGVRKVLRIVMSSFRKGRMTT